MTPEEWERWVDWWSSQEGNSPKEVVMGWKFMLINNKLAGPKDETKE